ncbi:MAG: ROK family protein [Anaerolineales bacterium]
MSTLHFVAVDLGGTQIRAARYTADAVQEARVAMATGASDGVEFVMRRIKSAIRQVWPMDEQVSAIGIGAPGPVDFHQGVLRFAPNLPGWENVPLRDELLDTFDIPVFLGNDADVAGLGEHRFGAGQGVSDMIYMTISTGVGGGMIFDNRLFTGGQGLGGEIGHMAVDPHGPRCNCGNIGCLEVMASGTAIARRARERLEAGESSQLREMVAGDLDRITAKEVSDAGAAGDELALALFEEAGAYLGSAIVSLMYMLNPALFVLGGGVTHAGDLIFDPIWKIVKERAPQVYQERTKIVKAELGQDVGLWGALALCLMELRL